MVLKLIEHPLNFRTLRVKRQHEEKFYFYFQKKHSSKVAPFPKKYGYFRQKLHDFIHWYDEFTGMDEVRDAHKRVLESEDHFRKCQEHRRRALHELKDIQIRLKDVHYELENTLKGDDRYVALVTQEHKLLKEEKMVSEKFAAAERMERESFASLSSMVKLSHEKERAQGERTKYWSIIASALGTVVGILGTSINNHFKMNELKSLIKNSSDKELLDKLNTYLEANEACFNEFNTNVKERSRFSSFGNVKIEGLLKTITYKLSSVEVSLKKLEQKTENNHLREIEKSDSGTEISSVENLTDTMETEFSQVKKLVVAVAVLCILMPFISKLT